ncbi:MAG: hypothetical protein E7254_09775 [Lachnospiraceae bacterium]|nr:hypothetical protein [Lachnospiraceae bacterium]
MKNIEILIKEDLGFTNTDYSKIRYVLTIIGSEISKLLIMFVIFGLLDKEKEYIFSVIVLLAIRTNSGGLHFNSYISCLIVSFVVLFLSIIIFPYFIDITQLFAIVDLFVCIVLSMILKPVRSIYRDEATTAMIKKCHEKIFVYLLIFLIIFYITSVTAITEAMFWTINLQFFQLIIANVHQYFLNKQ